MLMRGFVPDIFGIGVTVPVVKDELGDVTAARCVTAKVLHYKGGRSV